MVLKGSVDTRWSQATSDALLEKISTWISCLDSVCTEGLRRMKIEDWLRGLLAFRLDQQPVLRNTYSASTKGSKARSQEIMPKILTQWL